MLAVGLRKDEAARRTFSTRTPSVRSSTSVRSAEANLR